MSSFTYEREEKQTDLETYEWDNTWIDHANDTVTPRVLYIGDSISCATRRIATECAEGKILFDGFGTSKALDNPFLRDSIRLFAKQQPSRHAVIFNNGLHGWHLGDDDEYRRYFEEIVLFLKSEFDGLPIFIVLTTSVQNEAREERVKRRNAVIYDIASKLALPIIDLYSVSTEFAAFRSSDGVHYTREGYEKFAKRIVSDVKKFLV